MRLVYPIFCITIHMVVSVLGDSVIAPSSKMGTGESSIKASPEDEAQAEPAHHDTQLRYYAGPFTYLAPRQKVMGLVNAIALLRTKISLLEDMRIAFEPQTGGVTRGPHPTQPAHLLPGPALAYGDCRLGILGFEVCRHLGFLNGDPMVAPSSTQSKQLRLVGASSLLASFNTGHLNLQEDADLKSILSPQLLDSAVRALRACWNAQLFYPAFDARPVEPEVMREAMTHSDAFLFLAALEAKNILRFARSDYGNVGSLLASIFSDLPLIESPPTDLDASGRRFIRETTPQKSEEGVDGKSLRAQDDTSTDQGLFGGFLNRIFPTSNQPSQFQDFESVSPSSSVFSALANSMGGLTSMVTTTAQNAVRVLNNETQPEDAQQAAAMDDTEKRIGDTLNMIPDEIEGQF